MLKNITITTLAVLGTGLVGGLIVAVTVLFAGAGIYYIYN